MKTVITLLFACSVIIADSAFAVAIRNPGNTNTVSPRISSTMKASEFVKLSAREFAVITGKKMNMWNKLAFFVLKTKMKHNLKKDPNLTIKDYYTNRSSRHVSAWVWVSIGLAILLIVLIIGGLSVAGV